jgi:hypothetical protein
MSLWILVYLVVAVIVLGAALGERVLRPYRMKKVLDTETCLLCDSAAVDFRSGSDYRCCDCGFEYREAPSTEVSELLAVVQDLKSARYHLEAAVDLVGPTLAETRKDLGQLAAEEKMAAIRLLSDIEQTHPGWFAFDHGEGGGPVHQDSTHPELIDAIDASLSRLRTRILEKQRELDDRSRSVTTA